MATITYELRVHSRDVADILGTGIARHSGYDLIIYIDGIPTRIESLDLYKDSNNKIHFDIKDQEVNKYILDTTGVIHGTFVNDNGNSNYIANPIWLNEKNYDTVTIITNNDDALKAFNKIKLEASILNYFSEYMNYDILGLNCNASTDYFAMKYLNGINVFTNLDGVHSGTWVYFSSLIGTKTNIKTTINNLDKFYSLLEESGYEFDYENFDVHVEHKNDGWYLKITDGVKNYIFDDDYDSSITGSSIDDVIYLGNGRNVVNSGFGNDEIHGGKNVDIVYGGDGNDVLDGGGGSDTLNGGYGNDTYIYKRGYEGVLTINDEGSGSDTDRVLFGEGIDSYLTLHTIKSGNDDVYCEAA